MVSGFPSAPTVWMPSLLRLGCVIDWIGFAGHQTPPEARVADTFVSSSALTAVGPSVNDARFCFLNMSARLSLPKPELPGWVYERRPSLTAMSTTGVTPTCSMSLMNGVFGDVASACVSDIE